MRGTNFAASNAEESVGNAFWYTVSGTAPVVQILVASSTSSESNVHFLNNVESMFRTRGFGACLRLYAWELCRQKELKLKTLRRWILGTSIVLLFMSVLCFILFMIAIEIVMVWVAIGLLGLSLLLGVTYEIVRYLQARSSMN